MPNDYEQEFADIDLRPYLDVVRRNGKLILAITIVFIVVAALLSLLSPRSWTATSTVAVPPPPTTPQTQLVGGIQATPPTVVYSQATYARLLTSTTLLRMVIKRLRLQLDAQALAGMIQARPIRDTLLIEVRVTGPDRQQAETIANTLAESLVEYDRRAVTSELSQSREFVEAQLANAKAELQQRETALTRFNERENLAALQAELNQQVSNLTTLRQTYRQNKIDLGVARERLAQTKRELASTSLLRPSSTSTQMNTLGSSAATQLRARLTDLNAQRAQLLQQYTSNYPPVAELDAQIAQTQKALLDAERREPSSAAQETNTVRVQLDSQRAAAEVDMAGLEAKDRLLSAAVRAAERDVDVLNAQLTEKSAEANRLSRALDTAKAVFATLSNRATDAIVAEGMKQGFIRVADRAVAQPTPRGTVRKVMLAALLGFLIGVLGAFATERFHVPVPVAAKVQAAPEPGSGVSQTAGT